ncbi:MAG: type II toxin-antitoxin system HicA family toxin [Janthinobacterium lividum]
MKVKEVIKQLKSSDWVQVRQESSHRRFKKAGNPDVITVSGHDSQDVYAGQLSDIRRTSGLPLR